MKQLINPTLQSIANQCPALGGTVVYNARNLYNLLNNSTELFEETCETIVSGRGIQKLQPFVVNTPSNELVKLFPNPAKASTNIYIRGNNSYGKTIVVYDVYGKIIKTILLPMNQQFVQLSTKELNGGVYMVTIIDNNSRETITQKLIVE